MTDRDFAVGTVTFEIDLMLHDSGSGRPKHVDVVEQAGFLVEPFARYIEEHLQFDDAQVVTLRYMGDATTGTEPVLTRNLTQMPRSDD